MTVKRLHPNCIEIFYFYFTNWAISTWSWQMVIPITMPLELKENST